MLLTIVILSFSIQGRVFKRDFLSDDEINISTLTILTRHDITTTNEFTTRFLATPEAMDLGITNLDFRQATTDDGWKKLLEDPSKSVDIAWGGDLALFNKMEDYGLLKHITNQSLVDYIDTCVPDFIGGNVIKLKDADGNITWVGSSLSSFGFIVNHEFLSDYDLPIPSTWDELANETYYINPKTKAIALVDPPMSTLTIRICQIILQTFGWKEGWSVLTRMAANARIYGGIIFYHENPITDGDVGIALSIDFLGIIAMNENPDCEYIIPDGQTSIGCNPIALGKYVDNQDAAEAFIKYLLSPEGQTVWMTDGLNRLPINEDAFTTPVGMTKTAMYELFNETKAKATLIFNETLASEYMDVSCYYFHNTITKKHPLLCSVWDTMVTAFQDEIISTTEFNELLAILGEVNLTEQEAININKQYKNDLNFASQKDEQWQNFAESKYNAMLEYFRVETPTSTPTSTETTFIIGIFLGFFSLFIMRRKKKRIYH